MFFRYRLIKLLCLIIISLGFFGCEETDPELVLEGLGSISPYIQNVTTQSATILWESKRKQVGKVELYRDSDLVEVYEGPKSKFHEITLSGLDENSSYFYQVKDGDEKIGRLYSFRTAVTEGSDTPFTFVAIGDSGYGTSPQYKVAQQILEHEPAFIIHTGDVVYDGFEGEYPAKHFEPYRGFSHRIPFFPVMGDHDADADEGKPFFKFFSLPRNSYENTEDYFSFRYGNAHFIGLNSNRMVDGDFSSQLRFLREELQNSTSTWKFIYVHHPPYTNTKGNTGKARIMGNFIALAKEYGVDAFFSGDGHVYERIERDGIIYIVTGGGGAELDELEPAGNDIGYKQYHMVKVKISGNNLEAVVYNLNGKQLDIFRIDK